MKTYISLLILGAVATLATGTAAQAAPRYTIKDLGTLGGTDSVAMAVNASGQVTGFSKIASGGTTNHAFLYSDGVMTDLAPVVGSGSIGYGINASGEVVGKFERRFCL